MPARPNILFIYCDELRTDALNCYGHPTMRPRTPHIDALAQRGVLFANNFCNSPICTASRTCLMSGMYCEQTGVYANEAVWRGFEPPVEPRSWLSAFHEAGYTTANFGKTHTRPSLKDWQHDDPAGAGMGVFKEYVDPDAPTTLKPRGAPTCLGGFFPHDDPYPPTATTDHALEWLADRDGPWLCRVSYLQPHTPVCPPPWAVKLYEDEPGLDGVMQDRSNVSRFEQRHAQVIDAGNFSEHEVRLTRVYYYALTSWVDQQVGRLMAWLDQAGLAESTIVVFEADHGASLGEGGLYAKQMFVPQVHRVPRLFSWPGTLPTGQRRDEVCQSIDVGPTLLGLCGVKPDEALTAQFAGRDLFNDSPVDAVYSTIGHGQPTSQAFPNLGRGTWDGSRGWPRRLCVRTDQYRYDCNVLIDGRPVDGDDTDAFLCDWRADPAETTNLSGRPELAKVEAELAAAVHQRHAGALEARTIPHR